MLLELATYSGIFTKIKALEKNLLTYEDYYSLASQRDIKSFANMLFDNAEYSAQTQRLVEIGRIPLEKVITLTIYQNFHSVYNFITDVNVKKYLKSLNLKYKVGVIKGILRSLFDERIDEVVFPKDSGFYTAREVMSFEKLFSVKTLSEFMEALRDTEFHSVLSRLENKNPSLYELETLLDQYFYSEIWKKQYKYLGQKDRTAQMLLNGSDIDIHNIMYVYRLKKYYNIDRNQIYPYLIPIHYKLNKNLLSDLIQTQSEEDFRITISRSAYKNVFKSYSLSEPEQAYYRYMYRLYVDAEKKDPYSLQTITSHFFKKGQEVRNLITLIECIRYGLRPEESVKKLNIYKKRGDNPNG